MDEANEESTETVEAVQKDENPTIQNDENDINITKDIEIEESTEKAKDDVDEITSATVESADCVELNKKDLITSEDIVSLKSKDTVSSDSTKQNSSKAEESQNQAIEKEIEKENQENAEETECEKQSEVKKTQENSSVAKVATDVFKKPHQPTNARSVENNFDDHAEHLTYEEDGTAIYTDPKTKYQYKWSEEENNWIPYAVSGVDGKENPFENEHYRWCSKTQSWKPKETQVTETEHYKWNAEKNAWIPKVSAIEQSNENSGIIYSVDENGQRIYTDKDGVVYFWDEEKHAWFPKIDDDFMARYQMNYGFIDNVSAGEEEKRQKETEEAKRKAEELQRMAEEAREAMDAASGSGLKRKANQDPAKWFEIDAAHNTKVYVSNLPLDITLDEFAELMGKCGMIMRDPQTQKFKLKLYTEADGQIKGDGLCDYIKVESVNLALSILDEYVYRGHKIRVQPAKFEMRGEYNPALKPKRKKKDKEKLQKMKERLFDWRPEKMRGERTKNEKVVIIKNLFTPDVFEKDVQLILDYQNDLREECGKCGTVRKVVIYDCHPEGIAQINMASPEEADLVIQMMQGRYFGKRQLSAEHWDGKTKYKVAESEKDVQERLSNWDQFLETETDKVVEKTC